MIPTQVKVLHQSKLVLKWKNNSETSIPLEKLRKLCPCASCMAERDNQSKSLIPIFFSSQIKVVSIIKIGNYAIGISWEDGHNTGIYEFQFLKNLSDN